MFKSKKSRKAKLAKWLRRGRNVVAVSMLLLLAGVAFLATRGKSPTARATGSDSFPLIIIQNATPEGQIFLAYMKAGETWEFEFEQSKIMNWPLSNPEVKIYITDPSGNKIYNEECPPPGNGSILCGAGDNITASADGVYVMTLQPPDSIQGLGPDSIALGLDWRISIRDGGVEKPGRIWTDQLGMYQDINPGVLVGNENALDAESKDFTLYGVSDAGYIYQMELRGYNGILSHIVIDSVGAVESSTSAVSINKSTEGEAIRNEDIGRYHLFFEEPDTDLPDSFQLNGKEIMLLPPMLDPNHLGKIASFTPNTSATIRSGRFNINLDRRFIGPFVMQIDTNNNGSYDDAVDRKYEIFAPGGANNTNITVIFDGKDGQGNDIPLTRTIKARAYIDGMARFYVTIFDVEQLSDGLSITRLNGPGTDEEKRRVYWDDRNLNQTQGNGNGTWQPLCGSRPSPIYALDGADSSGGVHGWRAEPSCSVATWGDMRDIQTWAYMPIVPATELELVVPGDVPGPPNTGYFDAVAH